MQEHRHQDFARLVLNMRINYHDCTFTCQTLLAGKHQQHLCNLGTGKRSCVQFRDAVDHMMMHKPTPSAAVQAMYTEALQTVVHGANSTILLSADDGKDDKPTCVLLASVPATLTIPSCSVSCEFMLIICALLVYSLVVTFRVCINSFARTLAEVMSLRFAASLICF